jgi:hypothetical protein
MALSAAERAKKYRENLKNNPTKYNDYLKEENQRYRGRRERGDIDIKKKNFKRTETDEEKMEKSKKK